MLDVRMMVSQAMGGQGDHDRSRLIALHCHAHVQAIRQRPDFDRACYNLGTVFYAYACSQQSPITQRLPSSVTKVGGSSL